MKFFVKNMASHRSKKEVQTMIKNFGLNPIGEEIGEIEIREGELSLKQLHDLDKLLSRSGHKLIVNKKQVLVEKIKCIILEMVYYSNELPKVNYSEYISNKIGVNYTILSKLFSKTNKATIEQYIISQKIEHVKMLLVYKELTVSEIAWKLQYSSAAHLSYQFKKVTGITPSSFKKQSCKRLR